MPLLRHLVRAVFVASFLFSSTIALSASRAPQHVIFTYMGDPSTTLTANWQSLLGESGTTLTEDSGGAILYYDTVSRGGDFAKYASQAEGIATQIEGLEDRFTYRVQLTDLEPNTTYYLVVGNSVTGVSAELKVKTIPQDDSALRFVTGGDMGPNKDTRTLLGHAASFSPDFAVLGGDIAYANGNLKAVGRWDIWLNFYTEQMVTPEGYSIPIVLAIGNHETSGHFGKTKSHAPFYFGFFGQDVERSHFTRKFGENLIFYVLDSGHVASHASQVDWMREAFKANRGVKYQAAVYHVPLYPSHRDFMGHYSVEGQRHWGPVFDEFGLMVAFENHDHTFKRTHLLKDGAATGNPTGTLYLGDGCWGVDSRPIDFGGRKYLDAVGSLQHFWVVNMTPNRVIYGAVDIERRIFDIYPKDVPGAKAAAALLESKEQKYKLPKGTIHIEGYRDVGEKWFGGETVVTLQNPSEFPMRVRVEAKSPAKLLESSTFSKEMIILAPYSKDELRISFMPKRGGSVARDEIEKQLKVEIHFEYKDPERATPFHYSQVFSVPVRAKEEK